MNPQPPPSYALPTLPSTGMSADDQKELILIQATANIIATILINRPVFVGDNLVSLEAAIKTVKKSLKTAVKLSLSHNRKLDNMELISNYVLPTLPTSGMAFTEQKELILTQAVSNILSVIFVHHDVIVGDDLTRVEAAVKRIKESLRNS
jgi:hypothetical protein